jgi:hypothetical protein
MNVMSEPGGHFGHFSKDTLLIKQMGSTSSGNQAAAWANNTHKPPREHSSCYIEIRTCGGGQAQFDDI